MAKALFLNLKNNKEFGGTFEGTTFEVCQDGKGREYVVNRANAEARLVQHLEELTKGLQAEP
jgi:hypothetical protein